MEPGKGGNGEGNIAPTVISKSRRLYGGPGYASNRPTLIYSEYIRLH